jgi:hypothetical protein
MDPVEEHSNSDEIRRRIELFDRRNIAAHPTVTGLD